MKGRKKQPPAAPPETVATPFFVRFLEGQQPEEDAEATVSASAPRAQYTTARGAKKPAAKKGGAKKSAGKKAAAAKLVTLKYPSDHDEIVFYPYHAEAARIGPGAGDQTQKFPSDGDDDVAFAAVYVDKKDVPATAKAKPKEARIKITNSRKDILEAD